MRSDQLIPEALNHAEGSSGLVAVPQVTMKVGEVSERVVNQRVLGFTQRERTQVSCVGYILYKEQCGLATLSGKHTVG